MDGIFGVGITEMIIIALVLFVIGGPENTAKWARQAGRYVRQLRAMWDEFMKDVEQELGPEGKELMEVTREMGKGAADLRRSTSPSRLLAESARAVEKMAADTAPAPPRAEPPAAEPAASETPAAPGAPDPAPADDSETRYRAWHPPKDE